MDHNRLDGRMLSYRVRYPKHICGCNHDNPMNIETGAARRKLKRTNSGRKRIMEETIKEPVWSSGRLDGKLDHRHH